MSLDAISKSDLWLKVEGWCDPDDLLQLILDETGRQSKSDAGDSVPAFDVHKIRELIEHVRRVRAARAVHGQRMAIREKQLCDAKARQNGMAANQVHRLSGLSDYLGLGGPLSI